MMLTISNLYAHGYNPVQIDRLSRLGFEFRKPASTFPGSQLLQFIDFTQGPALEFIQVENDAEYMDFLPSGMVAYCPGISLSLPAQASKSLNEITIATESWGSNTKYVNDDGGDDPEKPGWCYLNFKQPVVRNTFIYLSSRIGPKVVKSGPTDHPNQVFGVIELVFDLDEGELANLAALTETEMVADAIDLGGVRIGARRIWNGSIDLPHKQFPLAAVVLQAANLDLFLDQEGVKLIEYYTKPAAHIHFNDPSWDVIVTT